MKLVFLGTGGFHPNERRHTACVFLPELGVAFDAGTSVFRLPARLATPDLRIFLSHAHLDHVCGLTYLLTPLLDGRICDCWIHGLPDKLAAVRAHLFSEPIFPVPLRVHWTPLEAAVAVPGGRVTWTHLVHPGGSVGYRLDREDGRSLAYVTDTTADSSYLEFLRGVDVLIHECNFPDEDARWCAATGHSHTSQVAELARAAGVGRLLLTHVDPQRPDADPIGLEAARRIFPNTELAEDLQEFDV